MADILIVDDEQSLVTIMKFILEKAGHRIREAYNGQEALEALGVAPPNPSVPLPDLVILDVMMPIVDGYTVAVAMRSDPRAARVPLLIITAKSDMRPHFEEIPAVAGFFVKPFDPKELRETVAKVLPGK